MDGFLKLTDARRRDLCALAGEELDIDPASIEKDFWVCWTLRELFTLTEFGNRLTFKGGTSLSKGWKLIERFSEDIDVVIDRDALGFGGNAAPDAPGITSKERERRRRSRGSLATTTISFVSSGTASARGPRPIWRCSSASPCTARSTSERTPRRATHSNKETSYFCRPRKPKAHGGTTSIACAMPCSLASRRLSTRSYGRSGFSKPHSTKSRTRCPDAPARLHRRRFPGPPHPSQSPEIPVVAGKSRLPAPPPRRKHFLPPILHSSAVAG